jgi:unsaturated chondroitin disaccharide hydrolase
MRAPVLACACLCTVALLGACRSSRVADDDWETLGPSLAGAFTFAQARVQRLVDRIDDDPLAPIAYPSVTRDGVYQLVGSDEWDAGFYPMTLWLLYELTGSAKWKKSAEVRTLGLWDAAVQSGELDLGYRMMAFAEGWRLTGDPSYQRFLGRSAQSLVQAFNAGRACVGAFRSNLHGAAAERARRQYGTFSYPVSITSLVTLESLFTAAEQLDDRHEWYRELAHTLRVVEDFVRPDGSTYDLVDYPPDCPARGFRLRGTQMASQGEGTWARGQAFALHGLAVAFAHTHDQRILQGAKKVADFFLSAPTIPADGIPYWDLRFGPVAAGQSRDTSAAAIAAAGLLELSGLPELDQPTRLRYQTAARKLLQALATRYLARTQAEGVIVETTPDGPAGASGVSMIAGDYFFLDGIRRLTGRSGITCAERRCEIEAEFVRPAPVELAVESDGATSVRWEPSGRPAPEPLRASYPFTLREAASLVVRARLAAPSGSKGAVLVSVDGEPRADDAWDLPPTKEIIERVLSRGDGRPRIFELKRGPHRLVLQCSDRAVSFDKFILERSR